MYQMMGSSPSGGAENRRSPITTIRECLTYLTPQILERLSFMDEIAMRAKIILEYMREREIKDVNQGIRSFTAFERERLLNLGIATSDGLRKGPMDLC